ncbi:hypothetical protein [Pedobacter metabolipauper]|uniref:Beta-lactamase regulating signal transducer with metallopeptidase domain n=1 Tax=Pedobacter metabolipauper TaxID=425513 RepID=A0A4R6SXS8_9SPHI|nr:hypothetical protein [Pedobacter metabolipauper]TDQ09512.1 hypothetical protein ATK78_1668 [Pedobacter metabolipauper]
MPVFITFSKLPANAMAIFPFILLKEKTGRENKILVNHERIHFKQQLELLILPFYLIYLFNYLINLIRYKDHDSAYFHIVFEKEAYLNERNLKYLSVRKPFAWLTFLIKRNYL